MPQSAVTIVITDFQRGSGFARAARPLTKLFDGQPGVRWDALLVDDGSRDRSVTLVREHAAKDARFSLIEFSRNFGFQAAITAGLAHAKGDAIVTMDADLQDPPELIPQLVAGWREGHEIVRAVRRSRQETACAAGAWTCSTALVRGRVARSRHRRQHERRVANRSMPQRRTPVSCVSDAPPARFRALRASRPPVAE